MSAALIPLTVAPFVGGALNPLMDSIFVAAILIHSHIGFQALITDYIPTWRMPKIRKAFDWLLNLATVIVGIGFYQFETSMYTVDVKEPPPIGSKIPFANLLLCRRYWYHRRSC